MKYRLVPGLTPAWATVILMVCAPTFLERNENRKITMPTVNLNIAPPPFRAQPAVTYIANLLQRFLALLIFSDAEVLAQKLRLLTQLAAGALEYNAAFDQDHVAVGD